MARTTYVKKAQQRYRTVPVIDPATGAQKVTPVLKKDGTPKLTKAGREIVIRLTENDKTQPLPNRKCELCSKEIEVGQPYKWIAPKSGPYGGSKRYRCDTCRGWRASETTSSTIKSIVYGAQEAFGDNLANIDTVDDLIEAVHDVGEQYQEAADAARESAENIEEGFGHATYQSDELNERADSIEAAAETLRDWEPDVEVDEDEARVEAEDEVLLDYCNEYTGDESVSDLDSVRAAYGDKWDEEEYVTRVDDLVTEKVDEKLEEAKSEAEDAITAEIEE